MLQILFSIFPYLLIMFVVLLVFSFLIRKMSIRAEKILSTISLSFGAFIVIVVTVLITIHNNISQGNNPDPSYMDEIGMLYLIYYSLLYAGIMITIIGIINTIHAFNRLY